MTALKNMTDAEYKAKMEELRNDLENWVESHGLTFGKLSEAIGGTND
jgi:hypothetical protein